VIVLTGESDEQSAREAMQAGADDLLVKPLDTAPPSACAARSAPWARLTRPAAG
jgi:FixJ family two-component response regulator